MTNQLRYNSDQFTVKTCELEGRTINYRAFENIIYCQKPVDPIQKMNIFVPEAYFRGEQINGYTRSTAPVFMPNTVGGYMPGPSDEPGYDSHNHQINSIFRALEHGYVVVSAGVRGRTSGKNSNEFFEGSKEGKLNEATGRMVGRAPAFIVDYKAAIRYLRHNQDLIPGNMEHIITNGTSAGGALSALAGATGNAVEYEPWLKKIGAADERDDIYAASCYCPIHNLENADAAYEWQFCGLNSYHRTKHQRTENGIIRVPDEGLMTDAQIAMSEELKSLFPVYVNGLALTGTDNDPLTLETDGSGSFKDHVKRFVVASAAHERTTLDNETHRKSFMVPGSEIGQQDYLIVENGQVVDLNWDAYIAKITRMKQTPAFDAVDLKSPENEEFGDELVDARHFTAFSMEHNTASSAELAEDRIIRLLNPTRFIRDNSSTIASYWRIRHGAFDRDTSLAIPVILATLLKNNGIDTDFMLPWGIPHSGDYDLDDLFAWIDRICRE